MNQELTQEHQINIQPLTEFKAKLAAVPEIQAVEKINDRDYAIEQAHNDGQLPDKKYERFIKENDKLFAEHVELVAA